MSDIADQSPDHSDESIDTHPDLIDPEWNARVEREAQKAVKRSNVVHLRERAESKPQRVKRDRWFGLSSRSVSALLGVLILVGLFVLVNRVSGENEGAAPSPQGAVPVGTAAAAPTPTSRQHSQLNLNTPFLDTPAAGWSDGETGIRLPAPAAVGKWSASTVADAESSVKQTLITAHLDPAMLFNHDGTAYLATLAPDARADEQQRLNTPNDRDNGAVSMIASGFHLLPAPIKVDGSMSPGTDPKTGDLVIHTNYVYAFAFDPGQARDVSQPWQIIVVQHIAEDFTVVSGSHIAAADKGLWVTSANSYLGQMSCTAFDQGYIAPSYSDNARIDAPTNNNDPDALYSPSHSLNVPAGCPAPPQHA
ncbi:MAG TPA: hypothetical protein VGN81_42005 [Pseudonocardiaceae bacterium]